MKVLLAMDGGEPAKQALSLLECVAASSKVHVIAVTVGAEEEHLDDDASTPHGVLGSSFKRLQDAGFSTEQRILEGQPATTILKEIVDGGFDLTVLGAGNRSRLGRILFGSVSTKVLHGSPTSVMIVNQATDPKEPVRVLVGTDGSRHADLAVDRLIAFADPTSCEVDVVSVAEHLMSVPSFPIPRIGYAASGPTPEVEREWLATAQRLADSVAMKLEAAGFRCRSRARLGAPASQLMEETDDVGADLVVVGSQGLGALGRAILGSVSDQLVRTAPATFVVRG